MASGGLLVAVLSGGLIAASALSGSADAAARRIEAGVINHQLVEVQWPGWQGSPGYGQGGPGMGRNGKAVASIVCVCASACAKSATAWSLLHHGSAIGWGPVFMKFASGCGMSAGVTGEKTNSSFSFDLSI
jgi:hypothetical protein